MNRLPRVQRWLVYATSALLVLTGVASAFAHDLGAFNVFMMKVHGGAAMAVLILFGTLLTRHVPMGWSGRQNRTSGVATLLIASALIVSGYLLYYTGDETYRQLASELHLGAGLVFAVLLTVHLKVRNKHDG